MTTAVSICSNALLMLGAQPINSFDEALDRARLASNLYPTVRDDLLRSHPWNCAVKRVVLAPLVAAPAFDYSYQFALPADWLRTLQVGDYGDEIEYRTEGLNLLANVTALKLRYVFRNEVEATWDSKLVHVATLAMAARMAYGITQSASLEQTRLQEFQMALKQAKAIDGQDDPPETFGDFPLFQSRFRSGAL